MKKNIFAALTFFGLVLAGCSKEEILPTHEPEVTPPAAKITTLTASLPDNTTTRTAFDETETALKVTWAEGDKITLYDETGAATEFTMKEGSLSSDGKSAKFVGEIDAEKSYTAVYPANAGKDAEAWKTFLAAKTAQQDMTEGKETKHLSQNVIMASDLAAGTTELSFSSQVAIMKVVATLPDGFTSLTPSSVSIKGAWGEGSYAVTLANATAASAIAAYIVAPAEETVADVTLSAQINFADGSEISYNMPAKSTAIASKLYTVKTSKALNGTMNGHAWVDLGIRKSDYTEGIESDDDDRRIVFATTNIGAAAPEEFGYYFRWGEQQGWAVTTDADYAVTSATQYDKDGSVTSTEWPTTVWPLHGQRPRYEIQGLTDLTCNGQTYGDAATYNWGGTWKMMNENLMRTLVKSAGNPSTLNFSNATVDRKWSEPNGVGGVEYSNTSTGQSFFMPAAVCYKADGSKDQGYTCYWTSTQYMVSSFYYLWIYKNGVTIVSSGNCSARYPIRPIAELPL